MERKPRKKSEQALSSLPLITPKKEYFTVAAQLEASYQESIPFHSIPLAELTPKQKLICVLSRLIEARSWRTWDIAQQTEFWRCIETYKVPIPLSKPGDLGKDLKGRNLAQFSPTQFADYLRKERELEILRAESRRFKEQITKVEAEIEMERNRRKLIGVLEGKKIGKYEIDPLWDDVIPIPQEDGEGSLAAITYTDEYVEAMGYLRAIMAAKEHSIRVLALTAHVINLNPAHYTVWLYRASTIMALNSSITAELEWVNNVAIQNQKNYQIWHHRQLLIDHLCTSIPNDLSAKHELVTSESAFIQKMLDEDSKNYHVWSYRQYLVRKFQLFNSELPSVEMFIKRDVRNNSAWSHRFFVVFSNPKYATDSAAAIDYDPNVPNEILEREKAFARASALEAPQNSCPWNYLRGVLRKGGQSIASEEEWVSGFVKLGEIGSTDSEIVKSSHALELLADIWGDKSAYAQADEALRLLGEKYDRIRKNYWEWKRANLKANM